MRRDDTGTLCTRSHSRADPEWTIQDMLILVNEIAAVEGDCQNALSSYQKWSIIAENCTGLGVVRNSNQCRRKWESLHDEYKLVKEWEANSVGDSYWSFGCEQRKEVGLPMEFDKDLYNTINDFTKAQERADTDPENDPEETEIDVLDVEESGPKPKRARHRPTPQKGIIKKRKHPVSEGEHEKPGLVIEQMEEQILAAKLKENAELIHAILAGNFTETVDEELADLKDEETLKTEMIRCKAEKLIVCLGDLTENLEQLCDVVEED